MKKVIYLYKSGRLLCKDYSLILKDKKNYVNYIPIEQIDTLICFGEISINKRTLSLLNKHNIVILFFNFYGQYIGKFTPKQYLDGKILINQIYAFENEMIRNHIARTMIISSLKNCLALLKYYNKKLFPLLDNIIEIESIIKECKNKSVNELLLLEAQAKKIYFNSFDIILEKEKYHFIKRTKNPPQNEINALLSYGYSLLYANYISVTDRSRLYSQISFVHSLTKCSESLQFDLADILKPVLVDRLVLSLCRHKLLKDEYFDYKSDRCYLNKEGVKFFVEKYENYLLKTIKINNRYYSYRNLISREVHLLSNYIANESNDYKPYIMKW